MSDSFEVGFVEITEPAKIHDIDGTKLILK